MGAVDFSDLITFTRTTGGGRFNAQGVYEWLPANTPRIDYDPVTGEAKGLLIEEQRTNLLTHSSDFANDVWTKQNGGWSVVTEIDPRFGAVQRFTEDTATGSRVTGRLVTLTAGSAYTHTERLKAAERASARLQIFNASATVVADFNLSTGTVSGVGGGTASIKDLGGGWFDCSVTLTAAITAPHTVRFYPLVDGTASYTGENKVCFLNAGAQLEAGSFPTSYIPTTTAQVTRAADIASVNELSPWYNPEQGTLVADFELIPGRSVQGVIVSFGIGNALQTMIGTQSGSYPTTLQVGSYNVGDTNVPSAVFPGRNKAGLYYEAGTLRGAANSILSAGATSKVPNSSTTRMYLGTFAGLNTRVLNGWLRSIHVYPRAMPDQLQALTA